LRSVTLSFVRSFVLSVSRITHERVNGRRPNMVGVGKDCKEWLSNMVGVGKEWPSNMVGMSKEWPSRND